MKAVDGHTPTRCWTAWSWTSWTDVHLVHCVLFLNQLRNWRNHRCHSWAVGWAKSISRTCMIYMKCNTELVLELSGGLAKLAHCGWSLWVLNTSATQCCFKSHYTHLEACLIPKKASMEAWQQSPKSEKKTPLQHVSCGLGHKHVQYLCDIHVQRVWCCSCYVAWPSWPIVGEVFELSVIWY